MSDSFNVNGLKKYWGTEKRNYILKMSDEELRKVWLEAGRPGVDKFHAAALRSRLAVTRKAAQEFVRKQETRQVFAPGPVSSGRVTAARLDDLWQIDLIDWKQMDASKNNGFKNVLVVDVFSRFAWAIPMESKTTEAVVEAFEGILRTGRKPSEVDTDGGLEFGAIHLLSRRQDNSAREAFAQPTERARRG